MKPKSVKKKMKTPAFAAAIDREQLQRAADELGVEIDEHIELMIAALAGRADELGIAPRESAAPG
jgi:predicted hydrolase (HD superfamily)